MPGVIAALGLKSAQIGWFGEPAARFEMATWKQAVTEVSGGAAINIQEMHVHLAP